MTFGELKKGNFLIITTKTKVEKKEIIELYNIKIDCAPNPKKFRNLLNST